MAYEEAKLWKKISTDNSQAVRKLGGFRKINGSVYGITSKLRDTGKIRFHTVPLQDFTHFL